MKAESMKILEYQIIQGDKARFFSEDVNDMIEQGFQPYGQMIVRGLDSGERYYQAMVKTEDNE